MKSASAYYLLLFYITAMFKPLLPAVKDMMAHLFWKEQHINTIHHEHGKDHLHHELTDADNKNEADHNLPTLFSEPVSVHMLFRSTFDFSVILNNQKEYPQVSFLLTNPGVETNIPPPKA